MSINNIFVVVFCIDCGYVNLNSGITWSIMQILKCICTVGTVRSIFFRILNQRGNPSVIVQNVAFFVVKTVLEYYH